MIQNENMLLIYTKLYELAFKTAAKISNEAANSFAADLPDVSDLSIEILESSMLPIVDHIESVGAVSEVTSELVSAIRTSYEFQTWRQPYSEEEIGTEFVNGSAWFPIADHKGPVVYTEGLVEIMLLNSNIKYPKHSHNPEEIYIVLAGEVWWEADNATESPMWKKAGDVIHHLPNQPHSISAGKEAVLILNMWRGGGFEMPNIN